MHGGTKLQRTLLLSRGDSLLRGDKIKRLNTWNELGYPQWLRITFGSKGRRIPFIERVSDLCILFLVEGGEESLHVFQITIQMLSSAHCQLN